MAEQRAERADKPSSDEGPADDDKNEPAKDEQGEHGDKPDEKPKEGDDKPDEDDRPDEDEKPPLYKRPIFWIVVAIVVVVLMIGGTLYCLHARKYESTDDAFIDAHIVRIAAETNGRLRQVSNLDNLHVRQGQLLAIIDPASPAASRQQAQATVSEAQAQIEQARAQVAVAEAGLAQARANARAPLAEENRAAADYARYLKLRALDPLAAAPTQIDQARAQAVAASGQAQGARDQIRSAAANVSAARRQVSAAQARQRAARGASTPGQRHGLVHHYPRAGRRARWSSARSMSAAMSRRASS